MRYFKYLALLGVLVMLPAVHSQAQVAISVNIGPTYGIYHTPPPCPYGYYDYYPFECAPYGYWGPEYFANGVFIGVGPWYRFYYAHPVLYERWYGPGCVRFPRYYAFRRFHRDFDDDRRFHHFDDERRYRGEHEARERGWRRDSEFRPRHEEAFSRGGREFHRENHGHEGHEHGRDHDHGRRDRD